MKLMKSVQLIALFACAATVFAQEDVDAEEVAEEVVDIDEAPEDLRVEVDEKKELEDSTGVVDPADYPGRVIHRKKIITANPAANVPLEFEYTIWNLGNTDVVDIELNDRFEAGDWSEVMDVKIQVAKIAAGAKHTELRTVTPTKEKKVKLSGAKLTYKSVTSETDSTLVQYQSEGASQGAVKIASHAFYKRHIQSHVFDWICFLALAVPSTVLPYMAGQSTITKYGKAKTA
jgi:hypothetical protein